MKSVIASGVVLAAASTLNACSDSGTMTMPEAMALARGEFEIAARVLGPVAHDDDADLRVSIRESNGVPGRLNFLRLTCSNGAENEWGAGVIASALGSNVMAATAETIVVVHYLCPNSSRPARILGDITDANGFHHQIVAAPFHPDWPGA